MRWAFAAAMGGFVYWKGGSLLWSLGAALLVILFASLKKKK